MMIGLRASPPRRISRRVRWTISTTRLTLSATGTVPSVNGCTESTSKYLRAWARYSSRACCHGVDLLPSATREPATTLAPRSARWMAG